MDLTTYQTTTYYDADICMWVEEVKPPVQHETRGLEAILRKAEEMGVSDRDACTRRVDFLKEVIREKELGIWKLEKRCNPDDYEQRLAWIASLPPARAKLVKPPEIRLGIGPNGLHTPDEIRRALEESSLLSTYDITTRELMRLRTELNSLEAYLKGARRPQSSLTEYDIRTAYETDVRKVLDAEGVPYANNGLLCCPIHKEKHPSASVAKGFLKCFSMGCRPPRDEKTGIQKQHFGAVELFQFFYGGSKLDAIRGVLAL